MADKKFMSLVFKGMALIIVLGFSGTVYGQHHMDSNSAPLTKPGNEIFGTIQEVVLKLEADPDTDWSKVDLEALRQHLLDMKAFTEQVEVVSKSAIDQGVEIMVQPKTERAEQALKNVFSMHPHMIKKEKGWTMEATQNGDVWVVTCTSDVETDVPKIRALGYIGLLTEGAHHPLHHWMIATGKMKME